MALSDQVKKAIVTHIWDKNASVSALATAVSCTAFFNGGFQDLIVTRVPLGTVVSVFDVSQSATVAATSYQYDKNQGIIFKDNGSDWGESGDRRRFRVVYTYGFSSIPDDVQLAIDTWVNYLTANNSGSISSYATGDDSESYAEVREMPNTVKALLSKYKRLLL
jgi:hypothetical protein